jgi:hypothetical protein
VRIHGQILLLFLADVGFTVGKLFPATYACRSPDCAKITHNCVMTLASFLFSACECFMLHEMTMDNVRTDQGSITAVVKMLEIVLAFAYVIYDAATTEPPGVGTTVLVVVACLAEVLLVCFEGYTVFAFTKSVKVFPS